MRKKILLSIGAVAIAATMVFTATFGITGSNIKMSALTLANIEALAKDEGGDFEVFNYAYQWIYFPEFGGYMQCCAFSPGGYCLVTDCWRL